MVWLWLAVAVCASVVCVGLVVGLVVALVCCLVVSRWFGDVVVLSAVLVLVMVVGPGVVSTAAVVVLAE